MQGRARIEALVENFLDTMVVTLKQFTSHRELILQALGEDRR